MTASRLQTDSSTKPVAKHPEGLEHPCLKCGADTRHGPKRYQLKVTNHTTNVTGWYDVCSLACGAISFKNVYKRADGLSSEIVVKKNS